MLQTMVFFTILITFSNYILRIWIVEDEPEELLEEGKELNIWGKIILSIIGIVTSIVIIIVDSANGNAMRWFFIVFIIVAMGFQAFVNWKYLKNSKQYIIPLILMVIGLTYVYYLF